MSSERLRDLKAQLDAEIRRTRRRHRFGRVIGLMVSVGLAGGALYGVLSGGGVAAWAGLVTFVVCSLAFLWGVMVDFGLVRPRPGEAGRPTHAVTVNDDGVSCRLPRGGTESVSWAALRGVLVQAVDAYPVGDVFWVLLGDDGTGCVVPIDAEGAEELLEDLQRRLPGFDNEAVAEAMGLLEGTVVAWRRPERGVGDDPGS